MKRTTILAGLVLVSAAALVGPTPSAGAAPPWTVSATSAPPPSVVDFTSQAMGPTPRLTLVDTATSETITCGNSRLAGSTTTGTYPTGNNLLHVVGPSFGAAPCVDSISSSSFSASGSGNWKFNAMTLSGGMTTGKLNLLTLTMSSSTCTFTTAGFSIARFYNGPQRLRIFPGGALTVASVSGGCSGVVNAGDPLTLSATYQLFPSAHSPITIT